MELKRGIIKGFSKPSGFIDGLKFHVNQVSGGIENGMETYYDLDNTGNINAVYGRDATLPQCYLEQPEEVKPEIEKLVEKMSPDNQPDDLWKTGEKKSSFKPKNKKKREK